MVEEYDGNDAAAAVDDAMTKIMMMMMMMMMTTLKMNVLQLGKLLMYFKHHQVHSFLSH